MWTGIRSPPPLECVTGQCTLAEFKRKIAPYTWAGHIPSGEAQTGPLQVPRSCRTVKRKHSALAALGLPVSTRSSAFHPQQRKEREVPSFHFHPQLHNTR